jgi:hypothetical protein
VLQPWEYRRCKQADLRLGCLKQTCNTLYNLRLGSFRNIKAYLQEITRDWNRTTRQEAEKSHLRTQLGLKARRVLTRPPKRAAPRANNLSRHTAQLVAKASMCKA